MYKTGEDQKRFSGTTLSIMLIIRNSQHAIYLLLLKKEMSQLQNEATDNVCLWTGIGYSTDVETHVQTFTSIPSNAESMIQPLDTKMSKALSYLFCRWSSD